MKPDDLPERLPLNAGIAYSTAHISMHAVLVQGQTAHFDDRALRGVSDVESGVEWLPTPAGLNDAERWGVVWIAVTHEHDGTRAYTGAVAETLRVDRLHKRGYRSQADRPLRVERAMRGDADVQELDAAERRALRTALVHQDPHAWDHASSAVVAALEHEAEGSA